MNMKRRNRPPLRFIPFRKRDVVEMCLASGGFTGTDQIKCREFSRLLQSVYHYEFHEKLENLKDSYAHLNPDRDTRKIGVFKEDDKDFVRSLNDVLDKANYEKLSDEGLHAAIHEPSLFKLKLHIELADFDEVLIYCRGESLHTEEVRSFFGFRKKQIEFSNFDRVVIYIKFSEKIVSRQGHGKPGSTMLKMFQNVPGADIEILFPNTRLGMRLIDKLMIGVPALIGGGAVLTTKIGTSLLLLGTLVGFWAGISAEPVDLDNSTILALLAGIGGLGAYIWYQFSNFKNRKLTFMQSLSENLYFKSLDTNAGVFHRLIDDAEEEECKEAILAYYFLLTQPTLNSESKLDETIEAWFSNRWDSEVDFEEEDAVKKLLQLGLITNEHNTLSAVSIDGACKIQDKRWDEYFSYNG